MFLFADQKTPERLAAIQQIADHAVACVWSDTSLRVPRTHTDRHQGFSVWLELLRPRFVESITASAREYLSDTEWEQAVVGRVWPQVAHELRRYATRGLAFRWVRDQYVESIYPGEPQLKDDGLWHVDLLQQGHTEPIGILLLDSDGDVVQVESQIPPRMGYPRSALAAA